MERRSIAAILAGIGALKDLKPLARKILIDAVKVRGADHRIFL